MCFCCDIGLDRDIIIAQTRSCLYGVDPEEGDVEASVEGEPDQVEGEEVKVEADHADGQNGNFDFYSWRFHVKKGRRQSQGFSRCGS